MASTVVVVETPASETTLETKALLLREHEASRYDCLPYARAELPRAAKQVLRLWFDGDLHLKYTHVWFAADGSGHQRAVDALVSEMFADELHEFERELPRVHAAVRETRDESPLSWAAFARQLGAPFDAWIDSPHGFLALVVLLDQCSRHVYRALPERQARVSTNDAACVALLDRFLATAEGAWAEQHLSEPEHIFLLMPYRHSATESRMSLVLQHIDQMLARGAEASNLVSRFRRATLRRMLDVRGAVAWDPSQEILEHHEFVADESQLATMPLTRTIEAFMMHRKFVHLPAVAVSLSGGVDSMVVSKILVYLRNKYGRQPPSSWQSSSTLIAAEDDTRDGGVADTDTTSSSSSSPSSSSSSPSSPAAWLTIVAIHIDYNNRPESAAEADFVEDWCRRHQIDFRKRCIREARRGVTKRDEYERLSREIRYAAYASVLHEFPGCPGVIFGHHRGDVHENVISNMMKGCSLLDLSGMHDEGDVNGVRIWRPMLTHPKSDIFAFAHRFGVPYLLDTTPQWSTRGKLRNHLMPLLTEMYGDGFLNHLSALALDSEQLNKMTNMSILEPFWDSVRRTRGCVWFDCEPYYSQPLLFWKETLRHVCHAFLGCSMIRESAIRELLIDRFMRVQEYQAYAKQLAAADGTTADAPAAATGGTTATTPPVLEPPAYDQMAPCSRGRKKQLNRFQTSTKRRPEAEMPKVIAARKPRDSFLALRKEHRSYMMGSILILYREAFFPPKPYYTLRQPIEVPSGEHQPPCITDIGPWHISCSRVLQADGELLTKRRLSMLELSSAEFEYYLPAAATYAINPLSDRIPVLEVPRTVREPVPLVAPDSPTARPVAGSLLLKVHMTANMGAV